MARLDSRVTALEVSLAPVPALFIYGEDPRASGMFRKYGDDSGRLMTREECLEDAGGNTAILVVYDDKETDRGHE